MAKIIAPNTQYNGESASVQFENGVGETDHPNLIAWFEENGYRVEDESEAHTQQPDAADAATAKDAGPGGAGERGGAGGADQGEDAPVAPEGPAAGANVPQGTADGEGDKSKTRPRAKAKQKHPE